MALNEADYGAPIQRRSTITSDVYERITALIMNHALEPASKISIEGLARQLAVSPTPVREAMARLQSDGLVTHEPLRGYATTPLLSRQEFVDLYHFRLLVEPWAAGAAAERIDAAGTTRLRAEMASCPTDVDGSDYDAYKGLAAHDARFHDLLLALAGNEVARTAFTRTRAHLHLFRLHFGRSIASMAHAEHAAIAAAVGDKDPDRAQAAMIEHLTTARDRLDAAFE